MSQIITNQSCSDRPLKINAMESALLAQCRIASTSDSAQGLLVKSRDSEHKTERLSFNKTRKHTFFYRYIC